MEDANRAMLYGSGGVLNSSSAGLRLGGSLKSLTLFKLVFRSKVALCSARTSRLKQTRYRSEVQ